MVVNHQEVDSYLNHRRGNDVISQVPSSYQTNNNNQQSSSISYNMNNYQTPMTGGFGLPGIYQDMVNKDASQRLR